MESKTERIILKDSLFLRSKNSSSFIIFASVLAASLLRNKVLISFFFLKSEKQHGHEQKQVFKFNSVSRL